MDMQGSPNVYEFEYSTVQYSIFIKSLASGSSDLIYKFREQTEKTSLQMYY